MWRVVDGDREVMALPVGAIVPSIYGPSADENPFAAPRASVASVQEPDDIACASSSGGLKASGYRFT